MDSIINVRAKRALEEQIDLNVLLVLLENTKVQ